MQILTDTSKTIKEFVSNQISRKFTGCLIILIFSEKTHAAQKKTQDLPV